eukprot:g2889.t1
MASLKAYVESQDFDDIPSGVRPTEYFEKHESIQILDIDQRQCIFHVYTSNLSEACMRENPVLVFIHGGGFSGMSWAQVAKLCTETGLPIVAFDLFGHGLSGYAPENSNATDDSGSQFQPPQAKVKNFSITRFVDDVIKILKNILVRKEHVGGEIASPPRIVLIGHSMGGAIATHTMHAARVRLDDMVEVVGLVVVDVVEGTALASLPHMEDFIKKIPTDFKTVDDGIEYVCNTMLQVNGRASRETIKASVYSRLRFCHNDKVYRWRTNLIDTQPYWHGWYKDMSLHFLGNGDGNEGKPRNMVKKLLVVAGMDRLDTPLTIAHMQGKFQYKNVPNSGHVIHEENPHVFFDLLMNFCTVQGLFSHSKKALEKKIQNAWTAVTPLETGQNQK